MGISTLAFQLAAAAQSGLNGIAGFFGTKLISRSDTPQSGPISINGVASQYTRITNYCVNNGITGSGSFGCGILQIKWSNDNKGIEDAICKSRATTIGGTPVAIQAGDVIYTQLWYGDAGPTSGAPAGSMAHAGWYRVAIDGAPTGDSTEIPGWYGLATGTGLHSPGSRYAFEANSKQQIHLPGALSSAFGPTGASYGANVVFGIGGSAAGQATIKFTLSGAALLAAPEAGAYEVDSSGTAYITNSSGNRQQFITADTGGCTITAGSGAGGSPTITITNGPNCGRITLTTGTSPVLNGTIATITYPHAFPTDSFVTISPANSNAGAASRTFYADGTASGFTLGNVSGALTAATQYIWDFQFIGK